MPSTRDAYTGRRHLVAWLSARVAELMGLDAEVDSSAGEPPRPQQARDPGESCAAGDSKSGFSSAGTRRSAIMLRSLGVEPISVGLHHRDAGTGAATRRLSGEDIARLRILFVADAYDAMTSDRIYQGHVAHEDAVAELERCAGTQFDPQVVAVFVKSVKRAEVLALKSD
jgi:hypothetical protein